MANSSGRRVSRGLLGEARGRLLTELCGEPQTATELAERVGTSSNAVRVHLDGLRAAGLVDYHVERRGVGKPRHVYAITASAENLLSSAYAPTLQALLDAVQKTLNGGFVPLLREVGASLGVRRPATAATRRGFRAAAEALQSLGGPVTMKTRGNVRVIGNHCCPLAAVTRRTPQVCQLMESLLSSASGLDVREQCERTDHPRCSFAVSGEL